MKTTDADTVKSILVIARKSKDKLAESIRLLQDFVNTEGTADLSLYYLARNRLRDGQALLDEVLDDAKKLLGPLPEYASERIAEMRKQLLRESGVTVQSPTVDGLEAELLADEYISSFMDSGKIIHYVREAGTYQAAGKRKLENLKVRMVIDELFELRNEARSLERRAGEKIQTK